jgi:hypothetical protein
MVSAVRKEFLVDWNAIKTEYITDESSSYRKLAKKYGVSLTAITNRAKKENWVELRIQFKDKVTTKNIEKFSEKQSDRLSRIQGITDKLLDKLERAVEELDIQLFKNVEKIKEIEYNNFERPDKPTKEIIHEEEKYTEVRTIIDKSGLKAIASALRDIKEVQMLKSELDHREQEARIRNLEKQAEADDKTDNEIKVIIEGSLDNYSK